MQARAQVIVLVALIVLAVMPYALAEDEPTKPKPQTDAGAAPSGVKSGAKGREAPPPPAPITYPGSRSSSTWIETPSGTRVAVGKGRSFRGVKVYLSLLWDLVGVDEKSGKALYAVNVGAFWNAFQFKEITVGGKKTWAVELAPGPRARAGKDKRQYHDVRTGKQLTPDGAAKPNLGKALKPRAVWSGARSRLDKPVHRLVTTQANWDKLRTLMFTSSPSKAFGPVDFSKEVVLLTSSGNSWNCDGISVEAAFENDARVLIRTRRHSYQTSGGGNKTRPYGVFVLPRRPGKPYVLERNTQGLIGGPALWKETWRATIGTPEEELKGLPAPAAKGHQGWER